MKRAINIFNAAIIIFFSAVIVLAVFGASVNKANTLPLPGLIVTVGAAVSFGLAVCLNKLEKNLPEMDVYKFRRYMILFSAILLAAQVITAVFADLTPKNDLLYVTTGAKNLILGKDLYEGLPEYHLDYFECYPNNHMLFSVIYILYKLQYILTGSINDIFPTALNIVSLNISYLLFCRCAEIIHTPRKAFVCAVRGMLFTPMITYASFFYTDSLAMPFVMASAYCYLKYRKSDKLYQLLLCGIFIGIGYKMKGSTFVLLIAIVIDMVIRKFPFKNIAAIILPCAAVMKIISLFSIKLLNISCKSLKEKAFPLLHWIMMSADGRGGYNSADFLYTQSFSGHKKISADLSRLAEKLNSQGIFGFLCHLCDKTAYTWENITFMAGYFYNGSFSSPSFITAAFFCHFTILFSILISLVDSRKKGADDEFIFKLCLFGLSVFLLIWETRCRYLVSFFPLFLLI